MRILLPPTEQIEQGLLPIPSDRSLIPADHLKPRSHADRVGPVFSRPPLISVRTAFPAIAFVIRDWKHGAGMQDCAFCGLRYVQPPACVHHGHLHLLWGTARTSRDSFNIPPRAIRSINFLALVRSTFFPSQYLGKLDLHSSFDDLHPIVAE